MASKRHTYDRNLLAVAPVSGPGYNDYDMSILNPLPAQRQSHDTADGYAKEVGETGDGEEKVESMSKPFWQTTKGRTIIALVFVVCVAVAVGVGIGVSKSTRTPSHTNQSLAPEPTTAYTATASKADDKPTSVSTLLPTTSPPSSHGIASFSTTLTPSSTAVLGPSA